ncbi:MAG TPA: thiamine phosphate synthase [Gammaproteobacteria bacterium]
MTGTGRALQGGLYLVVDPKPGADIVLPKVAAALRGGVGLLQVWNHWGEGQDPVDFVARTLALGRAHGVPVLVHERPDLLDAAGADGIHYDAPALGPEEVRRAAGRAVLYGVTCGNDLERVRWAANEGADYVSFCAMFPSPSAGECEIVSLETVAAARALGDITIFASGGVTPENASRVLEAGADGVAVISGILGAEDPESAARRYAAALRAHHRAGRRIAP